MTNRHTVFDSGEGTISVAMDPKLPVKMEVFYCKDKTYDPLLITHYVLELHELIKIKVPTQLNIVDPDKKLPHNKAEYTRECRKAKIRINPIP